MMRLAVKAITCAVLVGFFAVTTHATAETHDGGKKILAFGDSLMAGYGLPRSESFPAQLQQRLHDKGHDVQVINAGVSGDTTTGGVNRLPWTLEQQKPDYVILALGANDMLRAIDPATTRKNLQKMLETLKEKDVPVLLAGMRSPRSLGPAFFDSYNRMYRDLAREYDAVFYPFLLDGIAMNAAYNQADGVHPNNAGVGIMVDNMMPEVESLLKK